MIYHLVMTNIAIENGDVPKLCSGWWLTFNPSEKYEFVNWDNEIPNISGKIQVMFQENHQSVLVYQRLIHSSELIKAIE